MLVPDDKDWTWVLERPCTECGFDTRRHDPASVPDLVLANVGDWERLHAEGRILPGRPDPGTWSSLEYAAHVRDVYRRYDQRLALMHDERDPSFENWDQDASATDDAYDAQDPATVVVELRVAGEAVADRLRGVDGDEWDRTGRRSDGARFTIATLALYMVHDPVHHVWDVRARS